MASALGGRSSGPKGYDHDPEWFRSEVLLGAGLGALPQSRQALTPGVSDVSRTEEDPQVAVSCGQLRTIESLSPGR
jgi:hypothetical protein